MKITKQRLACLLFNAVEMLDEMGAEVEDIKKGIGITDEELFAIQYGKIEEDLTDDERYKIAREVDRENKLEDIVHRIEELDEDESSYLNGFTAEEIIKDESLLDEILNRYEKAEGWVDNSDYWYLIDDCINDAMKIERRMKNDGPR